MDYISGIFYWDCTLLAFDQEPIRSSHITGLAFIIHCIDHYHPFLSRIRIPIFCLLSVRWNLMNKTTEPNQSLEPTTTAVTCRAYARPAPAVVAAHL